MRSKIMVPLVLITAVLAFWGLSKTRKPPKPVVTYSGRHVRKAVVKYQGQLYRVYTAQPGKQGTGGIWVVDWDHRIPSRHAANHVIRRIHTKVGHPRARSTTDATIGSLPRPHVHWPSRRRRFWDLSIRFPKIPISRPTWPIQPPARAKQRANSFM